jgi:hypothetical protein
MFKSVTTWMVLGVLALVVWGASVDARTPRRERDSSIADKRKPKFTVGPETTHVTRPLDKNGYVDYAAALNEHMRKGVTPDDNANVLLWKAHGPHPEGSTLPAEYFQWLGVPPPPERGTYYVDFIRFAKDTLKIDLDKHVEELIDEMDRGSVRPWTAVHCPRLAAWLKANERPLALVVEATKRPRYFSPLVPGREEDGTSAGLITCLIPHVQKSREFAHALTTRAMLRLGQGRTTEAWQDLLACHRLGRHVAHGGCLIEALVGIAIDQIASGADVVFLDNAPLSAARAAACLRDLLALPPMPAVADKVDVCERFMYLETVTLIDRRGLTYFTSLLGRGDMDGLPKKLPANISWDPALRAGNQWFDRLVATMRVKDREVREKRMNRLEKALKDLRASVMDPKIAAEALTGDKSTPETRGQFLGDFLMGLLVPAVLKVQFAHDRNEQTQRNLHVAFALAQYRSEHGHYPKRLAALAPLYLAEVPGDLFAGKALTYRPSDNGYLLYSVGMNGQDDQGRSYDDEPPGDDIRVLLPLPPLPPK